MTLHQAEKVVIVTETIIAKGICAIIERCGATGYSIVAASGKGSRNMRSGINRTSVIEDFANVKIEVIVNSKAMAEAIMDEVTATYFENYSGIIYLEDVQILRPRKFGNEEAQDTAK